jgi:hypothetical protein
MYVMCIPISSHLWDEENMQTFDVHEAVSRTGATLRQIEHLVTTGLVTPAGEAPRRGMSRMFTMANLQYIAVAARLLSAGVFQSRKSRR